MLPKPAMTAARAAAVADSSWVRREPISMQGRLPAALVIREAAEAIAVSWLSTDKMYVSRMQASANVDSTIRMGEPGK
ncbi:hypothetical protein AHiyo1_52060 [Arthrobacter sp. Hiyo1]|nr:hypothetical protein AHiyo1_52060 [Arthrobacter sp. Hiyo1]